MASTRARAYIGTRESGSGAPTGDPDGRAPVEWSGRRPPEVESSVAFEALVEEPNLTLVADSFLQFM